MLCRGVDRDLCLVFRVLGDLKVIKRKLRRVCRVLVLVPTVPEQGSRRQQHFGRLRIRWKCRRYEREANPGLSIQRPRAWP
jgi:hypothetical protein